MLGVSVHHSQIYYYSAVVQVTCISVQLLLSHWPHSISQPFANSLCKCELPSTYCASAEPACEHYETKDTKARKSNVKINYHGNNSLK